MAICGELLRGWKRAFLLGARRIKLGAVEAARTRRPGGLASTVPHPAPPTGEDSKSFFPPSVFVRGFSYLGLFLSRSPFSEARVDRTKRKPGRSWKECADQGQIPQTRGGVVHHGPDPMLGSPS